MFVYSHPDPVALSLGPLHVRWYGLMYLVGFLAGWFLARRRAASAGSTWTATAVDDLIFYCALGVIIGGRLGWMLFYGTERIFAEPLSMFRIWEGGMSFHGGLLGTTVALLWFSKRHGIPIYTIADLAASVTPIGLGFGRLGNFINGELYGRPTDVEWCMVFPAGGPACRHPSQLYEASLEGVLLFTVLWLIGRRPTPPGTICWSFLTGYGICRIVVELFREPDAHIGLIFGSLSMGQMLSLPMIIIGVFMFTLGYQRQALAQRRNPSLKPQ